MARTDAVVDETARINAAIAAVADHGGGTVRLGPRSYLCNGYIDGTRKGITLEGVPGLTRIVSGDAGTNGVVNTLYSGGTYSGWTFRWITFDTPNAHQFTHIGNSVGCRFESCRFLANPFDASPTMFTACEDFHFVDCTFQGTRNGDDGGPMRAGVMVPEAAPGAVYGYGVRLISPCKGFKFDKCTFLFCTAGMEITGNKAVRSGDVAIEGCTFVGNWWDGPYKRLDFADATAVAPAGDVWAWSLSCPSLAGEGFLAPGVLASDGLRVIVAIDVPIASGAAWAEIYYDGCVIPDGTAGRADVRRGDVVETGDGLRAECTGVATKVMGGVALPQVIVDRWVRIDSREPVGGLPNSNMPWRITRTYAATAIEPGGPYPGPTATTIHLWNEASQPQTGEAAWTNAKLPLTGLRGRILISGNYQGLFAIATDHLRVTGCKFRGNWADQCSLNGSFNSRICNNTFECGQDIGLTIEAAGPGYDFDGIGTVVVGNHFLYSGSCAIFLGETGTIVQGNRIDSWGCVNRPANGRNAIHVAREDTIVQGNSFSRDATPGFGGSTDYCAVYDYVSCAGSLFVDNVDNGSLIATLYMMAESVPNPGDVVARNVASIAGPGARNVAIACDLGKRTFLAQGPPASGGPYVVGDRVVNVSPAAGGFAGWACVAAGIPGVWKGYGAIQP